MSEKILRVLCVFVGYIYIVSTMPSSVIDQVSYNEQTASLRIAFVSGRIYEYINVPFEIYSSLLSAGSKGAFFNEYIKDRFVFKKIE